MHEEQQRGVFGAHQCGMGDSGEIRVFTLPHSVGFRIIASELAGNKTTHDEMGHWRNGHAR